MCLRFFRFSHFAVCFNICCLFQYMFPVLGTVIQCDTCCGSIVLSTVAFVFLLLWWYFDFERHGREGIGCIVVCLVEALSFLWVLNSERHCVMLV